MTDDNLVELGRRIAESGKYNPKTDTNGSGEYDEPDNAELLGDVLATVKSYVSFPNEHQAIAVTLWIVATHGISAWQHATRLVVTSPQKRCGKSRLLDIVAGLCHLPLITVNATPAAIFRSIKKHEDQPPTMIVDEADALWGTKRTAEANEDLRALFNAGFQRGRPALRCVGPSQVATEFPTFAMAAFAAIGRLPDTNMDRAVNIDLQRREPDKHVAHYRIRRDGPKLDQLRARLADWIASSIDELGNAEPMLPVQDRAADSWEPLVAVADLAGGDWPNRARAACTALTALADDNDDELGTVLLRDIRRVFETACSNFMPSKQLSNELRNIEESPWEELTPANWLADLNRMV